MPAGLFPHSQIPHLSNPSFITKEQQLSELVRQTEDTAVGLDLDTAVTPTQRSFSHTKEPAVLHSAELVDTNTYPQPGHTGLAQHHELQHLDGGETDQRDETVGDALGLAIDSAPHPRVHSPKAKQHSLLKRHNTEPYKHWKEASPTRSPRAGGRTGTMAGSPSASAMGGNNEGLLPSPTHIRMKPSPSPSRHHLNALSPLQAFSPLQPASQPIRESTSASSAMSSAMSDASSSGTLSRSASVTRSLSRRQSLIHHAATWDRSPGYFDENYGNQASLFSKLTLVKAPAKDPALRRAKSTTALAPFSNPNILSGNTPATSDRGPRRSFAAASFAGFTSSSSAKPSATISSSLTRTTTDQGATFHRLLSPEQVVDMARDLSTPVVMPEGGLKGAELKRRRSSGASSRRSIGSRKDLASSPDAQPMALEPVEYVQMDDDTLLPFVDRPAEVKELLEHPSNEKLYKMLRAAFPKAQLREHYVALDPEEWNLEELLRHLTRSTRIECPDYPWVFRARQAVRAHDVALWEKLGTCLGCDGDLLNAGGEDGLPVSWGGLGLGEEGEYDPSANQVFVEALEAIDPEEKKEIERQLREEFGDIVEDEHEQAAAGMTALLGTIGEGEEYKSSSSGGSSEGPKLTTAQRAGEANVNPSDPLASPSAQFRSPTAGFTSMALPKTGSPRLPTSPSVSGKSRRSKSFVGLQIMTSSSSQGGPLSPSLGFTSRASSTATTPAAGMASLPVFDRGPESPLFPSSFSSLSVEPNLGRGATVGLAGGVRAAPAEFGRSSRRWSGVVKRPSAAGLSESAITFATDSDYGIPNEHREVRAGGA